MLTPGNFTFMRLISKGRKRIFKPHETLKNDFQVQGKSLYVLTSFCGRDLRCLIGCYLKARDKGLKKCLDINSHERRLHLDVEL